VFWGIGRGVSFHDQLHDRSWRTNPVPDPEKLYHLYHIIHIRGSTASRNPWNSTSRKLYHTRGDLPRVVKLIWLNVSYLTVICYVINNRCIIVIKYAVGQVDRPRGNFPRSVRLFRLNNAYSTVGCYVLNNTCIGLGVLV